MTDLVESASWLAIATILSAFDVVKALDPITRHPIDPSIEFENFVYRCVHDLSRLSRSFSYDGSEFFPRTPREFPVDIRPRVVTGNPIAQLAVGQDAM